MRLSYSILSVIHAVMGLLSAVRLQITGESLLSS